MSDHSLTITLSESPSHQSKNDSLITDYVANLLAALIIVILIFFLILRWRSVAEILFQNQFIRIPDRYLGPVYVLFFLTEGLIYFPLIFMTRKCSHCDTKWFHKKVGTDLVQKQIQTGVLEVFDAENLKTREVKSVTVNRYLSHCVCAQCGQHFHTAA